MIFLLTCESRVERIQQHNNDAISLVELNELIRQAHYLVEAKEVGRITQSEMANRIGVKSRTYTEYQRGTNAPLAMKALLNLLSMLDDAELLKVLRQWSGNAFPAKADCDIQQTLK